MTDTNLMLKVYNLENYLRNMYLQTRMQKSELQTNLGELYKPITDTVTKSTQESTTSQSQVKKSILDSITNLANANTKEFLEFRNQFVNFPDLVKGIDDMKTKLSTLETDIANKVKEGIDIKDIMLQINNLEKQQRDMTTLITDIKSDPSQASNYTELIALLKNIPKSDQQQYIAELPDEARSMVSEMIGSTSEADSGIASSHIGKTSSRMDELESQGVVQSGEVIRSRHQIYTRNKQLLEKLDTAADFVEGLKSNPTDNVMLSMFGRKGENSNSKGLLKTYVKHYAKYLNLDDPTWKRMESYDSKTYDELKKIQQKSIQQEKSKTGSGIIEYLPSNKKDLVRELARTSGSIKSGNTNKQLHDKLSSIVDELRRQKVLSLKDSKKLYKQLE